MRTGESPKRAVRVADRLREELTTILAREVRDPRLENVMVTRVEMPDDLSFARVLVRTIVPVEDLASKKQVLSGLVSAAGRLRKSLAGRIGLRRTPELRFYWDDGFDASERIGQLLAEIEEERKHRE